MTFDFPSCFASLYQCLTLRSLANVDEGKTDMVKQGAVAALVDLLQHKDDTIRVAASGTFPMLAAVELRSLEAFARLGVHGLEAVTGALKDRHESVR